MVRAGHMDDIYEIFGPRKAEEQVKQFAEPKVKKVKMVKGPEMGLLEVMGGVALGMACVVPYIFLMAALC